MTTTTPTAPATRRRYLPKPEGAIAKALDTPTIYPEPTAVAFIRRMLGADLLDVVTVNGIGHATRWLLVPVGDAELEFLAAYDAAVEDLEGDEREHNGDDEPGDATEGPTMWSSYPDWAPWTFPPSESTSGKKGDRT